MTITAQRMRFYTLRDLERLPQLQALSASRREAMRVVAHVLPFRANSYVVDELIDWSNVPDDPIFQLTFPQPGMIGPEHHRRMANAIERGAGAAQLRAVADSIRLELNPHPEGQLEHNVPLLDGEPVAGIQHKYGQTCLVFPSAGQTCHAYCTFCFRWAQFVGMSELKFSTDREMRFLDYIRCHDEITDVLLTGGDPMIMRAEVMARYIEPLLAPEFDHVQTLRIGTKMLSYWPYRLTDDEDAEALLALLERVVAAGKHLAIMAHLVHPRELSTPIVREAIDRLQSIGAVIRTQGPLVRHVNDDADTWTQLWKQQVNLGLVPYYMFVERDTGSKDYFKVPLHRAAEIYAQAAQAESGLGRTARGPTMSANPGKVMINGTTEIGGHKYFVLSFLQARNPAWCGRPFLAEYDVHATWLTDLRPAFGEREFFFERELRRMGDRHALPALQLVGAA